MESTAVKTLMELRGVGAVSARRLVEAGFDDFAKIAAAGAAGLATVPGLNPRSLPSILHQAEALAARPAPPPVAGEPAGEDDARAARLARVQALLQQLQREVDALAAAAGAGLEPVEGGKWAALQREAAKFGKLLDKLEAALPARLKRTGKALAKADRRLGELAGRGAKKTAGGLKKARKTLKKVLG